MTDTIIKVIHLSKMNKKQLEELENALLEALITELDAGKKNVLAFAILDEMHQQVLTEMEKRGMF